MTIPLILLAIHAGVIAVALSLSAYNGHIRPASEHERRVSDAVERAALSQLRSPVQWAAGSTFMIGGAGVIGAAHNGVPLLWAISVPPLVGVLSTMTLFYGCRSVHRALAQSATLPENDISLAHCTREALAAVLLTGAAAFGFTLGLFALANAELGTEKTQFIVLLSTCTIAVVNLIFARAATTSALTAHRGSSVSGTPLHGGSLALLVSDSFHGPLLILSAWTSLIALTQSSLLLSASTANAGGLWMYFHYLQLVGLFAAACGAWVARIQGAEPQAYAWLRAGLVSITLLIAGSWSLASQLPAGTSRIIPAGLTFFFLSLGILVWLTPDNERVPGIHGVPSTFSRPTYLTGALALSLVYLLLATLTLHSATQLSIFDSGRLLIAGAQAALPLVIVWAVAAPFDGISRQVARLAFIQDSTAAPSQTRVFGKLLGLMPLLCLFILLAAVQLRIESSQPTLSILSLGMSACFGVLLGGSTSSQVESNAASFQHQLGALVQPSVPVVSDSTLDLEAGTKVCEASITSRTWLWLLIVLTPSGTCIVLFQTLGTAFAELTSAGIALGLCLFGIGHAWLRQQSQNNSERMFGMMSLVTCVAQILLIFMVVKST